MSDFSFAVKDYRIIKSADFNPSGITLLWGKNGNGKSTLIKALVSLLSNRHSEDNFRHGQDSYSIAALVGNARLEYKRDGDKYQIQFNDEAPRSKTGAGPMYSIEPRFPLKRFDFEDSSFYPNISFQNDVPVLGDISASDLFSVMFSDVAKVSSRVSGLKKDCSSLSKAKADSEASSDMLKGKVSEAGKAVAYIESQYPDLETKYKNLSALSKKAMDSAKFWAEYNSACNECADLEKRDLVALYKDALPLFKDLVFVQKVKGLLNQLTLLSSKLNLVTSNLNKLTASFPVNVVNLVSGVGRGASLSAKAQGTEVSLASLPNVPVSLVQAVGSVSKVGKDFEVVCRTLSAVPDVSLSLVERVHGVGYGQYRLGVLSAELTELDRKYLSVQDSLRSFPCQRLVDGLCPYQNQIKV